MSKLFLSFMNLIRYILDMDFLLLLLQPQCVRVYCVYAMKLGYGLWKIEQVIIWKLFCSCIPLTMFPEWQNLAANLYPVSHLYWLLQAFYNFMWKKWQKMKLNAIFRVCMCEAVVFSVPLNIVYFSCIKIYFQLSQLLLVVVTHLSNAVLTIVYTALEWPDALSTLNTRFSKQHWMGFFFLQFISFCFLFRFVKSQLISTLNKWRGNEWTIHNWPKFIMLFLLLYQGQKLC